MDRLHTCRIHRYARASDTRNPEQSQATNGQSPPADNPEGKRVKVERLNSNLGTNNAEDISTGSHKRKREGNDNEQTDNDEIHFEEAIHLKRKREPNPNELIYLGHPVHNDYNPNLLGPVLKKRFKYGK